MLNINPSTIENVSIKEIKETEEVLKLYNNHANKNEEDIKTAVIADSKGAITSSAYDERIAHAKSYTADGKVPSPAEWSEIRTLYREVGNQKIANARERLEKLSKEYSGTASIEDERYGKITPKQAVTNYQKTRNMAESTKRIGVALSLCFGIVGFLAILFVIRLILNDVMENLPVIGIQLIGGASAILGLVLGGWLGKLFTHALSNSQEELRDYFELVVINNNKLITKLQTEIKSAEENIKRVEAQYGVEILARTDYSDLVPFNKKPIKKEETREQNDKAEVKENGVAEPQKQEKHIENVVENKENSTTEETPMQDESVEQNEEKEVKKTALKPRKSTKKATEKESEEEKTEQKKVRSVKKSTKESEKA